MNSISELENYCKIDNPVGALLLTGEWGCGKTYLIEKDLRDKLEDSHVIVRVSLFGIPSIEETHKAVKDAWIQAKGGIAGKYSTVEKIKTVGEKVVNLIPDEIVKGITGSVLSINPLDFIKVKNKIGDKKVILVFDDFERSDMKSKERLGIINEYCENQNFNVIIVADESKLEVDNYYEIKEKVIQRTVLHEPNYEIIVKSVINSIANNDNYKKLLTEHQDHLANSGRSAQPVRMNGAPVSV